MTVVGTSSGVTATAYSNQRKIDRTQNGVLWASRWAGAGFITVNHSTDDGATWSSNVGIVPDGRSQTFAGTNAATTPNYSMFIDLDDYMHVVFKDRHDAKVYHVRGTPNAARTSWTWSAVTEVAGGIAAYDLPDFVVHRDGTGWVLHLVVSRTSSTDVAVWFSYPIASDGTVGSLIAAVTIGGAYGNANHKYPSIDFNHTGDGKTIAGSSPHLYAAWSAGATGTGKGIRFRRAAYSSGSWSWGTERGLDDSNFANSGLISSIFDGTRVVVAYAPSTSTSTINIRERDAADTSTTSRTPTALSDGVVEAVSVTYDGDEDVHLWAVGATSDDVKRLVYDRSAGSWDTWTTVAAADALPDTLSLKRGYSDRSIEGLYTTGTGSPYDIVYQSFTLNNPPTASTWVTANNQAADINATLNLDWDFEDPDDGDTQGAYALRRQIGSGSLEYWNAGTSSWGGSEVKNTSSTTEVTLAASWGSDTADDHKYAVKTWDAADLEGTYSSELTVTTSAKVNPAIDSPAASATINTNTVTVEWTVAEQTAYRARLLTSGDAELESSGWVTSTSTSHDFSTTLENSTTYKVEIATKNDEGLTSDADTHTFSTSFTPPATPTLTVSEAPTGALTVAITNPGTGTAETDNDVFVRVASGGQPDLDRPVGGAGIRLATGVAVDGSYVDYAVASTVDYEYLVRAFADNGTSADSAWT